MTDFSLLANSNQVIAIKDPRARDLIIEINALRGALDCASGGESDVVYGRIDSLISERQDELACIYNAELSRTAAADGVAA